MLGVLAFSILLFVVALTRYISNRTPAFEASPTSSTTTKPQSLGSEILSSVTPSETPRPSWTPPASPTTTITKTITPTITRTTIPPLSPANPQTANYRYQLVEWNLGGASRQIDLVSAQAESRKVQEWYRAAAFTLQEALLQFPQSVNADEWSWRLARFQLLAQDFKALDTYSGLIQSVLQSNQVRITNLSTWFHSNEPDLTLSTFPLPPEPGELNRLLVQISGAGNSFLWLVSTPGNVQVTPLLNNFDPANNPQAEMLTADLTGDGRVELIIYESSHPTQTFFPDPWIFDLNLELPELIPIQDNLPLELGTESERQVVIIPTSDGPAELQLQAHMFPACPVVMSRTYSWNGEQFIISSPQVEIFSEPTLLGWCEIMVDHASLTWAPELTLAVAEPLLGSWPPAEDINGKAYTADALDEWRFRLGVLHALSGNQTEALLYFQTILDNPASSQSNWIAPARAFITTYQTPKDLYQACQAAPGCNLHHAIQEMVSSSGISSPAFARQYLLENGITGRTSGYFDFDGDGTDEAWLSLRPRPDGKLEFWIFVATSSGVQAVFVQIFEANAPQPYLHDPEEDPLVVQFERGEGFILERDPKTGEAAIRFVDVEYSRPTFIRDELNSVTQALFFGVDPAWVLGQLLEIRSSPRFAGDCVAFGICARFYYTLGLAYSLNGDQLSAIDWYLTTWREYPLSPYTLMSRLKIELIPATPTFTPTITPIPTITWTPDPLRTSTPTTETYPPVYPTPTSGVYP